jgi:hypothetical protein
MQMNEEDIRRSVRLLRDRSVELNGKLLGKARHIEITAFEPHTGRLLDRCNSTRLADLKGVVRGNRRAGFVLRISSDPGTAGPIRAALESPDYFESVPKRTRLALVADAWLGVSVVWPQDAAGRATIRDCFVVLIVERSEQASSED